MTPHPPASSLQPSPDFSRRRAFLARIQAERIRGEQLFHGRILFRGRGRQLITVHKVAERPTAQLARADLADWAWRFGKQLQIES